MYNMYKYIFLLLVVVCGFSNGLENLIGTPIESCINCICYARTGSWDISLCGRRLMTFGKWKNSGSLSPSPSWRPAVDFRNCRANVNCILNSIKANTERFGELDCNYNAQFTCEDRFYIQNFNQLCINRRVAPVFFNRFHTCLPNVNEIVLDPEETYEIPGPKIQPPPIITTTTTTTLPTPLYPTIQKIDLTVNQNVYPMGAGDNVNQSTAVNAEQNGGATSNQTINIKIQQSTGMDNLIGTPIEQCINCICYARTGMWDIYQCGHRLMKFDYWENSGSLTTSSNSTLEIAYRRCRQDANCIINTIKRHTEQFGVIDCNLDGKFDCQDRFAIQHYSSDCLDRTFHHVVFNRLYSCLPNFIEADVIESSGNTGDRNKLVEPRTRQDVQIAVQQRTVVGDEVLINEKKIRRTNYN